MLSGAGLFRELTYVLTAVAAGCAAGSRLQRMLHARCNQLSALPVRPVVGVALLPVPPHPPLLRLAGEQGPFNAHLSA